MVHDKEHEAFRSVLSLGLITAVVALGVGLTSVQAHADGKSLVQSLRQQWPWHLQTIVYDWGKSPGDVNLLITEPPSAFLPGSSKVKATAAKLGPNTGVLWVKTPRGSNGWVRDLVFTMRIPACRDHNSPDCSGTLKEAVGSLAFEVFGTTYKAHAVTLEQVPRFTAFSAPANLQVDIGGFANLFTNNPPSFLPWNASETTTFKRVLEGQVTGTFYSSPSGLVLFSFSLSDPLMPLQGAFRQFAIDSDILLGGARGSADQDRLVLIARERRSDIFQAPPLRFEDLELAVKARNTGQFQTFGDALFGGAKLCHGVAAGSDLHPAFLSAELMDTRYGSTLNATDVLIKSYTEGGDFKAVGLDLPLPENFPFKRNEVFIKSGGDLTYNWSIDRAVEVLNAPDFQLLMADQSASLAVSYFVESGPNLSYEEKISRDYFRDLRSLPAFEARQLTTLLAAVQGNDRRKLLDGALADRPFQVAKALIKGEQNPLSAADLVDMVKEGADHYIGELSQSDIDLLKELDTVDEQGEITKQFLIDNVGEQAQSLQANLNDASTATGLSTATLVKYALDWQIASLDPAHKSPDFGGDTFSEFLSHHVNGIDAEESDLLDDLADEIIYAPQVLCLIPSPAALLPKKESDPESNIKTTDYVVSNLSNVDFGGHNLHGEELIYSPTAGATKTTVRWDAELNKYVVEFPEELGGKIDTPALTEEIKQRDLRFATEPEELTIRLREPPSLKQLVAQVDGTRSALGATTEELPPNALFTGFGWQSEIGRLTSVSLERQVAIAESLEVDLIVKSVGGDVVIYTRKPPGEFLTSSNQALLETLAVWTNGKTKLYFEGMPKARVEAILASVPKKGNASRLEVRDFDMLSLSGNGGDVPPPPGSLSVAMGPEGKKPLKIITTREGKEAGPSLSALLGRRPNWSQATIERLGETDIGPVQAGGNTYFPIGWRVTLPEGKNEATYLSKVGKTWSDISGFVVKTFSRKKWTADQSAKAEQALEDILKEIGDSGEPDMSVLNALTIVRDEMQSRIKVDEVRFINEESGAKYEYGAVESPASGYAG